MNTTYHWRAHATNLLSTEFMDIARSHLKPGGIFFFNTTSSDDVQKTAMTSFPYGLRIINFVAVSDSPFDLEQGRWRDTLEHYTIDGKPCIDTSTEKGQKLLDDLVAMPDTMRFGNKLQGWGMETRASILARTESAKLITDDNMVPEFRQPLRFPEPD
jgi:hypothetical protein